MCWFFFPFSVCVFFSFFFSTYRVLFFLSMFLFTYLFWYLWKCSPVSGNFHLFPFFCSFRAFFFHCWSKFPPVSWNFPRTSFARSDIFCTPALQYWTINLPWYFSLKIYWKISKLFMSFCVRVQVWKNIKRINKILFILYAYTFMCLYWKHIQNSCMCVHFKL